MENSDVKLKEPERKYLADHVKAFLKQGKKIKKIESGKSGGRVRYNNQPSKRG